VRRWLIVALAAAGVAVPTQAAAAVPVDVAVAAGTPITRQALDHWMTVASKASTGPGEPLIVPTDPPRFNRCIARVYATIPSLRHTRASVLRADCAQLFTNLSGPELDLLITADWETIEARADGIVITAAQVSRGYHLDTRRQFGTPARFRRWLRRTGETIADVRFRVRVTLTHAALLKAEQLTAPALGRELTQRFQPQTQCARFYEVSDCAPVQGQRPVRFSSTAPTERSLLLGLFDGANATNSGVGPRARR
jgi:hypothetical protein